MPNLTRKSRRFCEFANLEVSKYAAGVIGRSTSTNGASERKTARNLVRTLHEPNCFVLRTSAPILHSLVRELFLWQRLQRLNKPVGYHAPDVGLVLVGAGFCRPGF